MKKRMAPDYLGFVFIRCPSSILLSFCFANRRNISPKCRRSSRYNVFRRHFGTNTTWYLPSHFVWDRPFFPRPSWISFIVCFSGSRSAVSAMDSRIGRTFTATPAEPGDLPTDLHLILVYFNRKWGCSIDGRGHHCLSSFLGSSNRNQPSYLRVLAAKGLSAATKQRTSENPPGRGTA